MNLYELPIYKLTEAIPMSPSADIELLAERIEENGQEVPVKIAEIDGHMMLIDGRHRLAACKLIGVEPTYEIIDRSLEKINALIFDMTFTSRMPNISQRAMWEAIEAPEGKKRGPDKKGEVSHPGTRNEISRSALQRARFVLKHSSHLTREVLAGRMMVKPAYETARAEVTAKEVRQEILQVLQDESAEHAERAANGEDINKVFQEYKEELEDQRNARMSVLSGYRKAIASTAPYEYKTSREQLIAAFASKECSEETRKDIRKNIKKSIDGLTLLLEEIQAPEASTHLSAVK